MVPSSTLGNSTTALPPFLDVRSGKAFPMKLWLHLESWTFVATTDGEANPIVIPFLNGSPVCLTGSHESSGYGAESRWTVAYGAFQDRQQSGPLALARRIFKAAEQELTVTNNGSVPLIFVMFEGYTHRAMLGRTRINDSLYVIGVSGGNVVASANHIEACKNTGILDADFDCAKFRQSFVGAVYGN